MNMPGLPFEEIFKNMLGRTPAQLACSHILSSRMEDGKFFCPSCRAVSAEPLRKPQPAGGAR